MFHSTPRARRIGSLAAAAAFAVTLAACSSGASTATSSGSSTGASGNSAIDAKLKKVMAENSSYDIPTESISGIDALKGKTVYYVPLTQQAPQFGVAGAAVTEAFKKVGISVQICNANANPTGIAACVSQATKAQAAAIITDAIPYVMAANAFQEAQAAGIPVLNTDTTADSKFPAADKLGYIYAPGSQMMVDVADWIISDSKGKATVVINEDTDGPSPVVYVQAAQDEFKKECSGCTVVINQISTSNFNLVPSSTSSALLKTPNVGYVVSEFDQFLQATLGGVQQAGKLSSVKGASGAAQLSGLQMLANKNFTYAEAGQSAVYQGYADADAVLRMLTGTSGAKLPEYQIPTRLFTRDNIGEIKLTDDAQASGEWFGPTTFPQDYAKLWGVN